MLPCKKVNIYTDEVRLVYLSLHLLFTPTYIPFGPMENGVGVLLFRSCDNPNKSNHFLLKKIIWLWRRQQHNLQGNGVMVLHVPVEIISFISKWSVLGWRRKTV